MSSFNDFHSKIFKPKRDIIYGKYKHFDKKTDDLNTIKNDNDKYLLSVYRRYNILNETICNLESYKTLARLSPYPDLFFDEGLHENHYQKLNYENFIIRTVSLKDYLAKFLIDSLKLEFTRKESKYLFNVIEKLQQTDYYHIIEAATQFNKSFSDLSKDRNKIIHDGTFDPDFYEKLDYYRLFNGDKSAPLYSKLIAERDKRIESTIAFFDMFQIIIISNSNYIVEACIPIVSKHLK